MADNKSKLDGKSGRPGFNKAGGTEKKARPRRNYSHRELTDRIDRYASVAKTGRQLRDILDTKKEYLDGNLKKAENRSARNRNYRLGVRAGIHPNESMENLRRQDREQDQGDRNKVAAKVKAYAHRNYTPSQIYNAHAMEKPKDRSIDKS